MKYTTSVILFLLTSITYSQATQYSLQSGINYSIVNSENFDSNNAIGLDIDLALLLFLTQKSDLIIEPGYGYTSFKPSYYKSYYNEKINLNSNIQIHNIKISALYNYYLLTPDEHNIYLSAQGGLGTTLLNSWTSKNSELNLALEGTKNFKPYYTFGSSIGFEDLRITLRYVKYFGNILSNSYLQSLPDSFNKTNEKELDADISHFSIKLTYLLNYNN